MPKNFLHHHAGTVITILCIFATQIFNYAALQNEVHKTSQEVAEIKEKTNKNSIDIERLATICEFLLKGNKN